MRRIIDQNMLAANLDIMRSIFKMDYQSMQMLGAFICTAYGQVADEEYVRECRKILHSEFGIFSNFRSHLQLPLIVKMSLADDPVEYIEGIKSTYDSLSYPFMLSDENRILASMILYDNIMPENLDEMCDRTNSFYKILRENHPVLTSQRDMPFAALMAIKGDIIDFQIEDAETCYEVLGTKFKLSKDEIQTVSHILSLGDEESVYKSEQFLLMYDAFKESSIGMTTRSMPILAALVNAGLSVDEAVAQTVENDEMLRDIKGFGGLLGAGSEVRRLFAASATALNNIPEDSAAESTVVSTILSLVISVETMVIVMTATSTSSH